jgi:phage terminase small subunit
MPKEKLTPKQELFCQEYIKDFNATRAALAAGYSEKIPSETGYENLRKPQIQDYLKKLLEKRSLRNEITQDRILEELAFIAFFDIRELFNDDGSLKNIKDLDERTARALAAVDSSKITTKGKDEVTEFIKKIKALDKRGALELLGKHLGMFADLIRIEDASTGFTKWLEGLYIALPDESKLIYEQYASANPLTEYSLRSSWNRKTESQSSGNLN